MADLFLASEILEINISEEHNGAIFYEELAKNARSEHLKKAASLIAQQEKMHEKRFIDLLEQVEAREPEESYPGEYEAYLKNLMHNRMFPDGEAAQNAARNKSDKEAIEFALQAEHATLNFLNELRKHIDPRDLEVVDITIKEEKDHIDQLNGLLQSL